MNRSDLPQGDGYDDVFCSMCDLRWYLTTIHQPGLPCPRCGSELVSFDPRRPHKARPSARPDADASNSEPEETR